MILIGIHWAECFFPGDERNFNLETSGEALTDDWKFFFFFGKTCFVIRLDPSAR